MFTTIETPWQMVKMAFSDLEKTGKWFESKIETFRECSLDHLQLVDV